MESIIKTAVGVGAAIGIGFLAYRQYSTRTVSDVTEKPNIISERRNFNIKRNRNNELRRLSKSCLEKIETIESQCFKGISKLVSLDQKALKKIIQQLQKRFLDKCETSDITSFEDVLIKLREATYLGPRNYSDVVHYLLEGTDYEVSDVMVKIDERIQTLQDEVIGHIQSDSQVQVADIVIMYSENDYENATTLSSNMYQYVAVNDLRVVLMDTWCQPGMLNISSFEKVLDSCLYIFLLITQNFVDDELNRFLAQSGMISDLLRSEDRWRFVPVWMTSYIQRSRKCPLEYCGIVGMKYYKFLENGTDTSCFDTLPRLVNRGREKERERFVRSNLLKVL